MVGLCILIFVRFNSFSPVYCGRCVYYGDMRWVKVGETDFEFPSPKLGTGLETGQADSSLLRTGTEVDSFDSTILEIGTVTTYLDSW